MILSIENHCSVPQQKKMAEYLKEVLQDKLDLSVVISNDCKRLPSPEILKGKVLIKVRPRKILVKVNAARVTQHSATINPFSRGKNCQRASILMQKKVMFLMKTLGMRKRKMMMTNRQFHPRQTDREKEWIDR